VIIRVLWGNVTDKKRINEIKDCCKNPNLLNERSLSIAIGQNNYDFLKDYGAKNLILFDKKDFIQPEGYNHFWHKPYIIRQMLNEYNEVYFLDWDCDLLRKTFDENGLYDLTYKKKEGVFKGGFQSTLRWYRRCFSTFWRKGDKNWNKEGLSWRLSMNACFVYSNNKSIIDDWLKVYKELNGMDETTFNFYYDKLCPYSSVEKMFEDISCYSVIHKTSQPLSEKIVNPIFIHK